MDAVVRRLGGVTEVWRFDRMATVCFPSSGWITPAFAQAAKHYGVRSVTCPRRRGNRKGVVEKANHSAAQRWWRTLSDDAPSPRRRPDWTDSPLQWTDDDGSATASAPQSKRSPRPSIFIRLR